MTSRAVALADARIARCTCGTWVYSHQPCGTCGLSHAARTEVARKLAERRASIRRAAVGSVLPRTVRRAS